MSQANALEQEMLELVNAERAKIGVAPLAFDDNLNTSAENHSDWMLENDIFDHAGVDGSEPKDRMVDAGYELEGTWAVGENIGWQSTGGEPGLSDDIAQVHENLMNSPSHREAILNPTFTEIGIGIEEGNFNSGGRDWDSVMVTQNFGTTEAEDSAPIEPDEDVAPVEPDTPEQIATVDEHEPLEDVTPQENGETIAATETIDEEEPQETGQEPVEANDDLIFTGNDADAFDWRDWLNLDFLDNLSSGSGNNDGNGNSGDGINGQGNGFGNTGTGVNGIGNGNGNSDWWNAQFELTEVLLEQNSASTAGDAATDWSWEPMDIASLGDIPELVFSFDDCFVM